MKSFLVQTELFQNLSDSEYEVLDQKSEAFSCKKNDVLFSKGDEVKFLYVLREGKIKIYEERKTTQREEIISVIGPNESFDLAALFAGENYHTNAQALEASSGVILPGDFIKQFLHDSPPFSANVVAFLSRKIAQLSEELTDLSLSSTKERLAKYLIREYEYKKRPSSFHLPLNQTQLASHLGTVREIVSRDLASLKKSKVIESRQGEISVLNPEELGKIAEGFSFHQ